jgi:GT2 family glycosyltransferase
MEGGGPRLSVVIPARNASSTLAACLDAACAQADDDIEIIVVDDASSDSTAAIASRYPAKLIRFSSHRGVAAARNAGAREARASVLLFIDADVAARPGLFQNGLRAMAESGADAVIGSYDDRPASRSIVSQFKNLAHHHFHQSSPGATTTFWGACGFVKRDRFVEAGGFDEVRFTLPSIEDVEFGMRMAHRGGSIRIEPSLQVTHLKRWTLANLIRTDIARRAIPWTVLVLETGSLPANLNFSWTQRIAAAFAMAELCALAAFVTGFREGLLAALLFAIVAVGLNLSLFALFLEKGGVRLAIGGFFLQQLYYLYSIVGFGAGAMVFWIGRIRSRYRVGAIPAPMYVAGFAAVIAIQLAVIYQRRQLHPGDFDVAREFGRRFFAGEDIYRGGLEYPYMPVAAMFFAPMAMLPAGVAFLLRYAIAVACVIGTLALLFRMAAEDAPRPARSGLQTGAITAILASHYIVRDLDDAGLHLVLLAMIVLGVAMARKGRDLIAALSLSVPIAIKITPVLLVALMVWKRRWKLAMLSSVAAILWIMAPAIPLGASRWARFQEHWARTALAQALGGSAAEAAGTEHAPQNQSLRAAIVEWAASLRTQEQAPASRAIGEYMATAAAIGLLMLFGWWSRRPYQNDRDPAWMLESFTVLVVILLLSPVTWTQHMVFLIPGIYLIAANRYRSERAAWMVTAAMAVYAVLSLVLTREVVGRARYLVLLEWHTQTICMLIVLAVLILCRPMDRTVAPDEAAN